jgi:hypothetical protein
MRAALLPTIPSFTKYYVPFHHGRAKSHQRHLSSRTFKISTATWPCLNSAFSPAVSLLAHHCSLHTSSRLTLPKGVQRAQPRLATQHQAEFSLVARPKVSPSDLAILPEPGGRPLGCFQSASLKRECLLSVSPSHTDSVPDEPPYTFLAPGR